MIYNPVVCVGECLVYIHIVEHRHTSGTSERYVVSAWHFEFSSNDPRKDMQAGLMN